MKEKTYKLTIADKEIELVFNKMAQNTNGSVLVKMGETQVLATVVMSDKTKEDLGFFPLSVDYEENYWAAGKIKGSRFVKRKGRPSDEAILSGRLIDRSIRPLFPEGMRNEIQVIVNVLSFDFVSDSRFLGFIAVSAALEISDIPFEGPMACSIFGVKEDKLINLPTIDQMEKYGSEIFVAGVGENISMVEAGTREVSEELLVESFAKAQEQNKKISQFIQKIAKEIGKKKIEPEVFLPNQDLKKEIEKDYLDKFEQNFNNYQSKTEYEKNLDEIIETIIKEKSSSEEESENGFNQDDIKEAVEEINKKILQNNVLKNKKRIDGRAMDEVRELEIEVSALSRTHGSALFKRGDTQALTVATLGAPGSELILEGMTEEREKQQRYMHFYDFPPYSVGECRPMRGPGRREIGHGALGEKALVPVIPSKEKFPYTILMNTEIMSSDGSTSMASVCGSTLALMDAGVPLKSPVSGVAMGLVVNEKDLSDYQILTDLCAKEDFGGHMDFKVAGTKEGITALQMDIKVKGLTLEILKDALQKAQAGRIYILDKMLEIISSPRKNLSAYAPRIEKIKVNPDKIRDIIGPGGKMINSIIDQTGVQIDIEDEGIVFVTSNNEDSMKDALQIIESLIKEPEVGQEYIGKVTKIMDFGAFVEFLPGQEGLVHISKLGRGQRVNRVSDVVSVGQKVKVKLIEIDKLGRNNLDYLGPVE
ncbi:MAG: polyribonucleotide nucleotidyltransferase [Candidatus Moranbacteria bacterium]|nr:polyribonucleotide nucleotidyltransferase [Candidatus Moranbacteria bacterium]